MKNVFGKLSQEAKAEKAIQLAVMDILEVSPNATSQDIAAYMGSTSFEASVKNYISLMN